MRARGAGPLVVLAVGVLMAAWTWRQWPDVLIDFGRELYIPWQLAAGKVLYRDVASFHGPLSAYVNALWFRLFGVSLLTLALANLVLLAALTALLYSLLRRMGTRLGATLASVTFLTLFAFAQYVTACNYNFVCPYSHEVTHGVLLSVLGLFLLARHQETGRLRYVAGAGLTVGLLFLTKVEVFVAGALSGVVALVLMLRTRPSGERSRAFGLYVGSALVPPVLAGALFWMVIPLDRVLREPLGYWTAALRPDLRSLAFFRQGMGTDDVAGSLRALLAWTGIWALVLAPSLLVAWLVRKPGWLRHALTAAAFFGTALVLVTRFWSAGWSDAARPLPLFVAAIGGVALADLTRGKGGRSGASFHALRISFAVLSLVLLLKMILRTRVFHYGFALAMPAALLVTIALVDWIPRWIDGRGGSGTVFRLAVLGAWAVVVPAHLAVMREAFHHKTVLVGSGADAFWADERGEAFDLALEHLRTLPPGRTLSAFPEGAMLNYLGRLPSSIPYTFFIPFDVLLFGEERILASLRAAPPDYVALLHRDTSPYGFAIFGHDYAREIWAWVGANYEVERLFGAPPFQSSRFGILLLRRAGVDVPPGAER